MIRFKNLKRGDRFSPVLNSEIHYIKVDDARDDTAAFNAICLVDGKSWWFDPEADMHRVHSSVLGGRRYYATGWSQL